MNQDPYETLGVPRDASDAVIKKAFRRKAKKAHPDANPGDPTAADGFDRLKKATDLLLHPDRRAHYDRTGDASDRRPPEHGLDFAEVVGVALERVLSAYGGEADKINILSAVVREVKEFRKQVEGQAGELQKELKKMRKSLGRVKTKKDDAPNLIEMIVAQKVAKLEESVGAAGRELDRLTRTLAYLDGCECSGREPAGFTTFGQVMKASTTTW